MRIREEIKVKMSSRRSFTGTFKIKSMGSTQHGEEKRVSEMTKMTLMQTRHKLLLCLGYGANYVK